MVPDPYRYFRIEGRQLVDQLGHGVLDLEKSPVPPELVPTLLRFAHTLKGAARVVKQAEIATLAHSVEDALTPLRDASASRDQVDQLLRLFDQISTLLANLEPSEPRASSTPAEEPAHQLPVEPGEMDALLTGLAEVMVQVQTLRRRCADAEHVKRTAELLVVRLATSRGGELESRRSVSSAAEDLHAQLAQLEDHLSRGVDLVHRELRQVLDTAERLRLVPASAVFGALERVARDAARSVGKQIDFRAEGGDIRLEADVLVKVQRALIQLVRNAVAHGIEDEGTRRRLAKPSHGSVELRVARRGNQVSFVCRDDGGGIDFAAVQQAAREHGAVEGNAVPSSDELRQLLLRGGLSTSRGVTEISGRGVGLDVVREALAGLGGQVDLRSTDGKGAEFELVVPVSLASLEALLVEAAGQTVAVPLDAVRRVFRHSAADVSLADGGELVTLGGQVLPMISLAHALDPKAMPATPRSVVVLTAGTATVAVGVNRVLGIMDIVLRRLPPLAPGSLIAMGACLDVDGNAQLVLDEHQLVTTRQRDSRSPVRVSKRLPILVVDDSVTTRMLEQSILESAGYEVAVASSAEDALELVRRQKFGLFLVDVEMPGMDGFGFVKHIRDEPELRDTPAIMVTSRDAPEDRKRGEEAGAISYIVKSAFDQGELLEIVRRALG